jgi:hypothetical protein
MPCFSNIGMPELDAPKLLLFASQVAAQQLLFDAKWWQQQKQYELLQNTPGYWNDKWCQQQIPLGQPPPECDAVALLNQVTFTCSPALLVGDTPAFKGDLLASLTDLLRTSLHVFAAAKLMPWLPKQGLLASGQREAEASIEAA